MSPFDEYVYVDNQTFVSRDEWSMHSFDSLAQLSLMAATISAYHFLQHVKHSIQCTSLIWQIETFGWNIYQRTWDNRLLNKIVSILRQNYIYNLTNRQKKNYRNDLPREITVQKLSDWRFSHFSKKWWHGLLWKYTGIILNWLKTPYNKDLKCFLYLFFIFFQSDLIEKCGEYSRFTWRCEHVSCNSLKLTFKGNLSWIQWFYGPKIRQIESTSDCKVL